MIHFLTAAEAASLGVELCTLEEAFARGDVVSLHAPSKTETQGMITGRHFSLMKNGATFINTARAGIVNQHEMVAALTQRPDITAILDVFEPEPVPVDSPLMSLGNVVMSPHIAGSLGPECQRCGPLHGGGIQALSRWRAAALPDHQGTCHKTGLVLP